jgi:hypothetical protein
MSDIFWYCQSCNENVSGNRVGHFTNKHYFRAKYVEPTMPRFEEANIIKLDLTKQEFGLWYHECTTNTICMSCRVQTDMNVSMTEKSIRLECLNEECGAIVFYRHVQIERITQ